MNVENKKGLLKGRKNKSVKKGLGALYQCSYKILWKINLKVRLLWYRISKAQRWVFNAAIKMAFDTPTLYIRVPGFEFQHLQKLISASCKCTPGSGAILAIHVGVMN